MLPSAYLTHLGQAVAKKADQRCDQEDVCHAHKNQLRAKIDNVSVRVGVTVRQCGYAEANAPTIKGGPSVREI